MLRTALVLFAFALPGNLQAQCPTGDDLAGGIAFTGPDGEREVFTALGDGLVAASYRYPDGYATEAVLAHGAYLVELLDLVGTDGETRTRYEFPMAISDIKLPEAGGTWDVLVAVSDGRNNVVERQVYVFGALEEHRFGDCAYDVIPYTAEYSTAPDVTETYHYLPALGLSYLYGYVDPTGTSTYPYTAIEALN